MIKSGKGLGEGVTEEKNIKKCLGEKQNLKDKQYWRRVGLCMKEKKATFSNKQNVRDGGGLWIEESREVVNQWDTEYSSSLSRFSLCDVEFRVESERKRSRRKISFGGACWESVSKKSGFKSNADLGGIYLIFIIYL